MNTNIKMPIQMKYYEDHFNVFGVTVALNTNEMIVLNTFIVFPLRVSNHLWFW